MVRIPPEAVSLTFIASVGLVGIFTFLTPDYDAEGLDKLLKEKAKHRTNVQGQLVGVSEVKAMIERSKKDGYDDPFVNPVPKKTPVPENGPEKGTEKSAE